MEKQRNRTEKQHKITSETCTDEAATLTHANNIDGNWQCCNIVIQLFAQEIYKWLTTALALRYKDVEKQTHAESKHVSSGNAADIVEHQCCSNFDTKKRSSVFT